MPNDNTSLVTMWFEEVWNKGRVDNFDQLGMLQQLGVVALPA